MDILSSKLVKTRKPHKCVACGRVFPAESGMFRVSTADGGTAYTDYICTTCSVVMHRDDITDYSEGSLFEAAIEYEEELLNNVRRTQLVKHQIYRHFKGGTYIVEDFALDTITAKKVVIYRALYGNNSLFTRPIDDFLSKVDKEKYPEASQTFRFEAIDV